MVMVLLRNEVLVVVTFAVTNARTKAPAKWEIA